MAPAGYSIRPEWPETMLYEEGEGRTIRFDCHSLAEPPVVSVPTLELWSEKAPAWAHAQRAEIMARLRAARCIVCEESEQESALVSLDGTVLVELTRVEDERTGPWERVRVLRLPRRELLAATTSRGTLNSVRFPREGTVQIAITNRYGEPHTLLIDTVNARFSLLSVPAAPQSPGNSWPLAELDARLGYALPMIAPLATEPRSLRSALGTSLGSVLLSAAGVWRVWVGESGKDRVLGTLCALFFAACAIAPWLGRRKR